MGRVITKQVGTSANVFAKQFKPVSQRRGYINTLFLQCKSKILTEYMLQCKRIKRPGEDSYMGIQHFNGYSSTLLPLLLKTLFRSSNTITCISSAKINSHNLQIYKYIQICFNFFLLQIQSEIPLDRQPCTRYCINYLNKPRNRQIECKGESNDTIIAKTKTQK